MKRTEGADAAPPKRARMAPPAHQLSHQQQQQQQQHQQQQQMLFHMQAQAQAQAQAQVQYVQAYGHAYSQPYAQAYGQAPMMMLGTPSAPVSASSSAAGGSGSILGRPPMGGQGGVVPTSILGTPHMQMGGSAGAAAMAGGAGAGGAHGAGRLHLMSAHPHAAAMSGLAASGSMGMAMSVPYAMSMPMAMGGGAAVGGPGAVSANGYRIMSGGGAGGAVGAVAAGGGGGGGGGGGEPFNRTVYLGGLPDGITAEQVLDHVFGGLIDAVRLVPEKQCAFVSFIHPSGAQGFYDAASVTGVTIGDRNVRVGTNRDRHSRPMAGRWLTKRTHRKKASARPVHRAPRCGTCVWGVWACRMGQAVDAPARRGRGRP